MSKQEYVWSQTLPLLLALAARLEGEGQYNNAKLARAAAEGLARKAAYETQLPPGKEALPGEIKKAAQALSTLGAGEELVKAMLRGAAAMADGRLPLINETPHGHVCRTCGTVILENVSQNCPVCDARPATFKRFLPVYWLENFDPFEALHNLRSTPQKVSALLEGLSESDLNIQPEDGGWAIRNIISHMRDAQGVFSFRVDLLLDQDNPILESKAVFEWATSEVERPPSTGEIFGTYQASRQKVIARLESLPLADWWRSGQHEEFGVVTVMQQASYFATHELTHLPQIQSLRAPLVW